MVTEVLQAGLDWQLEGSLDKAVACIQELQRYNLDKGTVTHTNLRLEVLARDYEEGNHLCLVGDRQATPEEIATQEEEDNKQRARQKEWDLKQLEALKKKYPDLQNTHIETDGC